MARRQAERPRRRGPCRHRGRRRRRLSILAAAAREGRGILDHLLTRRVLLIAGKGGTGKTTIAAALALTAAREGKRVLAIEVDAKGDLAEALGHRPVGFTPVVVQKNLSVLELQPEEAFQEYLRIFFKVPRLTRLTPLARVFDFIATGVPGPRDMLVVGKIAYEERREENGGRPVWDLIVVDCAATGHVLSQLTAARSMMQLVRGGMIRSQVEFVDAMVTDADKTALCIVSLPEEMPVVEALELHDAVLAQTEISMGACFLNRAIDFSLSLKQRRLLDKLAEPEAAEPAAKVLGDGVAAMVEGVRLAAGLAQQAQPLIQRLRSGMSIPVLEVPLNPSRPGLAMTRALARAIDGSG